MKWNALVLLATVAVLGGCSQEAEVSVENLTGGELEGSIDRAPYLLNDGEMATATIDIGTKFIFGPDEKDVLIVGEGTCKFAFSTVTTVKDDDAQVLRVYGDKGYLTLCNRSFNTAAVFFSACSDPEWGSPDDYLSPGECKTWAGETTCWDMLVESTVCSAEVHDIVLETCLERSFDFSCAGIAMSGASPSGNTGTIIMHAAGDEIGRLKHPGPSSVVSRKSGRIELIRR